MASINPPETIKVLLRLPGQKTLEQPLEVESEIGSGGMATVYKVRRLGIPEDSKHVVAAMKLLGGEFSEDLASRFFREIRFMDRMSHPNIATFVGSGTTLDARPFYLAEFIDGYTLTAITAQHARDVGRGTEYFNKQGEPAIRMKSFGQCKEKISTLPIQLDAVQVIMRGILQALIHSHGLEIVHRDLKPDNVMLTLNADSQIDQVKVLDFGISKILNQQSDETKHQTSTGTIIGTPEYMAPEQMEDSKKIDQRADIFSAGLILLTLLTGLRFMSKEDSLPMFFANRLSKTEPSFDPSAYVTCVPDEIRLIVLKATQYNREDRYQSAAEMLHALEEAFEGRISDPAFAKTILQKPVTKLVELGGLTRIPVEQIRHSLVVAAQKTKKAAVVSTKAIGVLMFSMVVFGMIVGTIFLSNRFREGEGDGLIMSASQGVRELATSLSGSQTTDDTSSEAKRVESVSTEKRTASASASAVSEKGTSSTMNETQKSSFDLGMIMLRNGREESALKTFLGLEENGVRDPVLFKAIASAYSKLGKKQLATSYRIKAENAGVTQTKTKRTTSRN